MATLGLALAAGRTPYVVFCHTARAKVCPGILLSPAPRPGQSCSVRCLEYGEVLQVPRSAVFESRGEGSRVPLLRPDLHQALQTVLRHPQRRALGIPQDLTSPLVNLGYVSYPPELLLTEEGVRAARTGEGQLIFGGRWVGEPGVWHAAGCCYITNVPNGIWTLTRCDEVSARMRKSRRAAYTLTAPNGITEDLGEWWTTPFEKAERTLARLADRVPVRFRYR